MNSSICYSSFRKRSARKVSEQSEKETERRQINSLSFSVWDSIAKHGILSTQREIATTAAIHLPTLLLKHLKPTRPDFQFVIKECSSRNDVLLKDEKFVGKDKEKPGSRDFKE